MVQAVRHLRQIRSEIRALTVMDDMELATAAKLHQAPLDLVRQVAADSKLPVVLFCSRRDRHPGRCVADDAARVENE